MKSIRNEFILIFMAFTVFISAALGIVSTIKAKTAVTNQVEFALEKMAVEGAKLVSTRIGNQIDFLETLSENWVISEDVHPDNIIEALKKETQRMDYQSIGVANPEGTVIDSDGTTENVANKEYFIRALRGESYISDVHTSEITGELIIIYAVPIKRDNKVIGVLAGVRDGNNLSNLIRDITYGENGYSFMINHEGTSIAHPNPEAVLTQENIIEIAKSNTDLRQLADIQKNKMVEGQMGVDSYYYMGQRKIMGFAPVPGTRWSIGVTAEEKDALKDVKGLTWFMFMAIMVIGIISAGLAIAVSTAFANPIVSLTAAIERFGDYDLTLKEDDAETLKYLKRKDEIGRVGNAILKMQHSMVELIKNVFSSAEIVGAASEELSAGIEEISSNTQSQAASSQEISGSVEEITANIQLVADNMQTASRNVGVIVNAMGEVEGVIGENTRNLEDINHSVSGILVAIEGTGQSIDSISGKSRIASKEAQDTVRLAGEGKSNLDKSVSQMEGIQDTILELSQVTSGLGKSAGQIGEITELIKDIAEQTNLLALNASIEAARAGEHGKGFAVVAQAIGTLADESSNATKEIAKVIKNIQEEISKAVQNSERGTKAVENGTHLIKETSNSLENIFKAIQTTAEIIADITEQMEVQSKESQNIHVAANGINDRVSNLMAAMEEETASATEIKSEIQSISILINEISASMQQQSAVTEEVSNAINENAQVTEEISSSGEEIAKSSEELAMNAQKLLEQVEQFKI